MATVGLDFIRREAATAASAAAVGFRVFIVFQGGDDWRTDETVGTVHREFYIELEG